MMLAVTLSRIELMLSAVVLVRASRRVGASVIELMLSAVERILVAAARATDSVRLAMVSEVERKYVPARAAVSVIDDTESLTDRRKS